VKKVFQLIGGHPALDLVNTLDWRFRKTGSQELIETYDDLLRFSEQSKVLTRTQIQRLRRLSGRNAGGQALKRCLELREAIAEILYPLLDGRSPAAQSLKTLEQSVQAARLEQRLHWKKGRPQWDWRDIDAELPVRALALSASELLISRDLDRVRACDSPGCRWLFLDTSKNHTRRWCDMKVCGNRMKARKFKARLTIGSSARASCRIS
jgi:predicted RNA-binding Zn ribbon-like protein